MSMFDIGTVVATYPSGNSVDVLMDDGSRLANVQVMASTGTDQSGEVDLPDIGGPLDETRWLFSASLARNMRAVVGYVRGLPMCFGFLPPQVNQISFADKNRRIMRHASDVYTSIDDAGNFELFHPSGTYLRIGSSPAHEDLTAKDIDKKWAIARNTGAAPYVHLGVSNGGSPVSSLELDPSGNVTVINKGSTNITTTGNVSVAAQGNASITAAQAVNITGGSGVSITTTGGTPAEITSSGPVSIKAPAINLN